MKDEATTPDIKKEEATSSDVKEAITSDEEDTTPSSENKVAELESEVATLKKEIENQTKLQSQADKKARTEKVARKRVEQKLAKIRSGEVEPEYNSDNPSLDSNDSKNDIAVAVKLGISDMIFDNSLYQKVLNGDNTLKMVIRKNPLALIDDAIDAEDAIEQIKEVLDRKANDLVASNEANKIKSNPTIEGKEFEVGVVQPSGENAPVQKETPQEKSNFSADSIETSIRSKIKME